MMNLNKKSLIVLFLILFNFGYSQIKHSYPNFIGEDLNSIENNLNWKIIEKTSGILSKDGIEDYALILESKDSILEKKCFDCKLYKYNPRIILVFISQNGENKAVIQNNKFIESSGFNLPSLYIENGLLRILYDYIRSNDSLTFELYNNNQLKIVYAESNGVNSGTGDYGSSRYDLKKKNPFISMVTYIKKLKRKLFKNLK